MKALKRNKQRISYQLCSESIPVVDENGFETGEKATGYSDPVEWKVNVSPASGETSVQQFGTFTDYDKVLCTCELDCPLNENSVLFVDREPTYDGEGKLTNSHDYVVKKVAKSLNSLLIAIQKVDIRA